MGLNKILIVTTEFPPQPGGIGNHALNVANQLIHKGFEVVVLTNERSENGVIEKEFDNKKTFEIVRIRREKIVVFTYWNRWRAYYKLIVSEKPELTLASGKFSLWLVGLLPYAKKIKKVAVVHGSEVNLPSRWEKQLVNKSLKKMDTVIAVSNFTKQFINPLNLSDVAVIPNGFNPKEFQYDTSVKDKAGKSPKLITVGALSQRKGQHNVLKSLPILRKQFPDIQYHLVGIPLEIKKLKLLATTLNITELVSFHGALNQKELVCLLNKSDIFVMLSETTNKGDVEGFGIALLEANYLGIPTIGALNCGIEDAIDNYQSGILIPHNDPNAFKLAIEEIMNNKASYAENAKKWAKKHTWELVIQKYIEVLEGLLNR